MNNPQIVLAHSSDEEHALTTRKATGECGDHYRTRALGRDFALWLYENASGSFNALIAAVAYAAADEMIDPDDVARLRYDSMGLNIVFY